MFTEDLDPFFIDECIKSAKDFIDIVGIDDAGRPIKYKEYIKQRGEPSWDDTYKIMIGLSILSERGTQCK